MIFSNTSNRVWGKLWRVKFYRWGVTFDLGFRRIIIRFNDMKETSPWS